MSAAPYTLNVEAFALFVHVRGQGLKLDRMADVAASAGVSKAQYFRAVHKRPINITAFLTLCLWMEANPHSFLIDVKTGRTLAPLPDANVPRETSTETRGLPQSEAA